MKRDSPTPEVSLIHDRKYDGALDIPNNWLWRATEGWAQRSRKQKYQLFMSIMRPVPTDTLLDVGASNGMERSSNYLEAWYPWPRQIVAISDQPVPKLSEACPEVTVVQADGRILPFAARQFDIGFSNAVIEHMGSRQQQAQAVAEMLRTCKRVFITTPSRGFPLDPHTLLPFAHWLPTKWRGAVYTRVGKAQWATEAILNPLSAEEFRCLFPDPLKVRIVRQRMLGLTHNLIAVWGPR